VFLSFNLIHRQAKSQLREGLNYISLVIISTPWEPSLIGFSICIRVSFTINAYSRAI